MKEKDILKHIEADYPIEQQAQIQALYEPFRSRKKHDKFQEILLRSKGDVEKVEKFCELAKNLDYDFGFNWFDLSREIDT